MHEYSIVQSLLESCLELAKQNNAIKITKVVIKVGIMSGVEPNLLQTAFDTFKENTICEEAKFIINHQPIVIKCHKCKTQSTLKKNDYNCPKCQSTDLDIIDGEELYLMQLELM